MNFVPGTGARAVAEVGMTDRGMELLWLMVVWNGVLFGLFGWDKLMAMVGGRRTPEKTLLGLAFLGGGLGAILGSLVFHHKIRKGSFRILLPLALLMNLLIGYWVFLV